MAHYTGKNLYATFVYSGGTVTLSGDQRTLSISPSAGLADATAGADTYKSYLPTVNDTTVSISMLATGGDTSWAEKLAPGTEGTLTIGVEGNTTGKPRYVLSAICMGAKINAPYADVVEISCDFQGNGAPTVSTF